MEKFEGTKDGQLLNDIFIGRITVLFLMAGCDDHYTNHAGYMASLNSEWECLYGHLGLLHIVFFFTKHVFAIAQKPPLPCLLHIQ